MNDIYKLLAETLPPATGAVLAVEHGFEAPAYQQIIAAHQAVGWCRVAGLRQAPESWPAEGRFAIILLPLPKGKESLRLTLAAAATRLQPQGSVYLFGSNDDGIKSAGKVAEEYFRQVEVLAIGGKGRIYRLCAALKADYTLDDFKTVQQLPVCNQQLAFTSYAGLFAKGRLDAATSLLLDHLPAIHADAAVLDYACGIGVIARAVQIKQPAAQISAADYDPLAVQATQLNVPQATVICTDDPASVQGRFDFIFSNPPIHDGAALSYALLDRLIGALPQLLAPRGAAYLVTQVTVPVVRLAQGRKLVAAEVAATSAFRVTKVSAA